MNHLDKHLDTLRTALATIDQTHINSMAAIKETATKFSEEQDAMLLQLADSVGEDNTTTLIEIQKLGLALAELNDAVTKRFAAYQTKLSDISAHQTEFLDKVFFKAEDSDEKIVGTPES
jgi:hypothetical protein